MERWNDAVFKCLATRGVSECIRSDNGSDFTAQAVKNGLSKMEVKTLYIEPGSPWENGYVESFHGKMRDDLLDREIFYMLLERAGVWSTVIVWSNKSSRRTTRRIDGLMFT